MTHMGLRFSIFWVFLALVYATARFDRGEVIVEPLGAGRPTAADRPEAAGAPTLADHA